MKLHRAATLVCLTLCLTLASCATHKSGDAATVSPPVSALARFDAAPSINPSDIPSVYNPAKLGLGSTAQYRSVVTDSRGTNRPFEVFQRKLERIAPRDSGQCYLIRRDNGNGYFLLEADNDAVSHAFLIGQQHPLSDKVKRRPDQWVSDVLMHGLAGEIMSGKLGGGTKVIRAGTSDTKITDWTRVGDETLTVNKTPLRCVHYQVAILEKGTTGSATPNQGRPLVREYTYQIWVADEVPFGIVKSEKVARFFLQEGSAPGTVTENSILEKYSLK